MGLEQADRAREALKEAIDADPKWDATNLSREIKRGDGYIRDFLEGRKRSLGAAEAYKLERILELPVGTLLGGREDTVAVAAANPPFRLKEQYTRPRGRAVTGLTPANRAFGLITVDGEAKAGMFEKVQYADDLGIVISAPRDPIFPYAPQVAFQIGGDSMNEAKPKPINEGDFIICALWEGLDVEEESGLIVVVERTIAEGQLRERTVKELQVFPDHYECVPRSTTKDHETIVIPRGAEPEEYTGVRIYALVRFVFDNQPLPNGRPRPRR